MVDLRRERVDRIIRSAATVNRDVWGLHASDVGIGARDTVELADMVERSRGRPGASQEIDVLAHAAIATRMVGIVAIPCLVSVTTPGDDVNSEAAVQVVECRKLACSKRGRDEARSMR